MAWGLGLLGAVAWAPWSLQVKATFEAASASRVGGGFWLGTLVALAGALAAGVLVGSRDSRGLRRGATAGCLAAGVAWSIGALPGSTLLAIEAPWELVRQGTHGRGPLSIALADALANATLWTVVGSWVAMVMGAIAGATGAATRPVEENPEDPPAWVLLPPVLAGLAVVLAFLGFTTTSQVLPALDVPGADPVVETERALMLGHSGLSAFVAALLGFSTGSIARVPSLRWRAVAALDLCILLFVAVSPWLTVFNAEVYAWLRQWPIYATATPIAAALGLAAGLRAPRRSPSLTELGWELALLATTGALLTLGPGGAGGARMLAIGVGPITGYIETGTGQVPAAGPLTIAAITNAPWMFVGAVIASVILGPVLSGPRWWLLRLHRAE